MPTDPIAIGLSAVALANSQAAKAEAEAVHRAQCEAWMPSFQPSVVSVEQQRTYAECVSLLHPSNVEIPHEVIIAFKLMLLMILIGGTLCATIFKDEFEGPLEGFFMGVVFTITGLLGLGLVLGAFYFILFA
jgi:hypothetical protein